MISADLQANHRTIYKVCPCIKFPPLQVPTLLDPQPAHPSARPIARILLPNRRALILIQTVADDLDLALTRAPPPARGDGHAGRAHEAGDFVVLERHRRRRRGRVLRLRLGEDALRRLAGHLDVLGLVDLVQLVAVGGREGRGAAAGLGRGRDDDLVVGAVDVVPGGAVGGEGRPGPELVCVVAARPVAVVETGLDETDELVEHGELELQLEGVEHGLDGRLAHVFVRVFQADQNDVHADAEGVDKDQLPHHPAGHAVRERFQDPDRGPEVDGGDDEFLDAESGQLDPFHHVEHAAPRRRIGRIAADGEDDRRYVQRKYVENDHPEDISCDPVVANHQVEPREEHECLTGDHADPSYLDPRDRHPPRCADEEFEDEAQRVQHAAPGTDEKRPEVQAAVPLEGQEYGQIEFHGKRPRDGGASG